MLDEKKFAVLIDADNISAKYIKHIFDEISSYGTVTYKRIYADWTTSNNNHWKDVLLDYSINPIQQYRYTTGKNSSDSALIIDAMDILYTDKIDGFCLVSSDSDFTKLATRLRESGMQVIGMGEQKTPKPFVSACNQFKYLDVLAKAQTENVSDTQEKHVQTDSKQKNEKAITSLETIKHYIVKIITDIGDDDFGMNLGNLGHQITKIYPDFDTRYFGHSKFSKFLEELGLKVVINQSKQMVYLNDDLIPENEKPTTVVKEKAVEKATEKKPEKKTEVSKKADVVKEKNIDVHENTQSIKIDEEECYFTKNVDVQEEKPKEEKLIKKVVDKKTKATIVDILKDSSKLGIGLNLDYVKDLICKEHPEFKIKEFGYENMVDFFKSLDFIQIRQLRDGGELVYLKTRFINQLNNKNLPQVKTNELAVQKAETKEEKPKEVKEDNTKQKSFKITKIQNGIPADKTIVSNENANTPKIVAPQKIIIHTEEIHEEKTSEEVKEIPVVNQAETLEQIPEFSEELKAEIKQEVYNIVRETGKTGIYIGALGKMITAKYPDFDVRGFGFMKLSSLLRSFGFIKLKSKNMSRRNLWAYFIEK